MSSGYDAARADELPPLQVFRCEVNPPQLGDCLDEDLTGNLDECLDVAASILFQEVPDKKPSAAVSDTSEGDGNCRKGGRQPNPSWDPLTLLAPENAACAGNLPLHRVRQVRVQQGISERTVARRLGIEVKRYRAMEDPQHDLSLTELHALQVALDVPISDLLEDRHSLSRPVEERAKLVKIMKTAVALRESKLNPKMERMTTMLCEQLVDLMPELAEVSGWPQFGARRGASAIGKALQQPIDMSKFGLSE